MRLTLTRALGLFVSLWSVAVLTTPADGKVEIILVKGVNSETWWSCVQIGHPQINVKDIEGAKYLDDSILKKIYEQKKRQKAEGEAKENTEEGDNQ